ncbi:MAG: hypothetical protein QHJ73_03565 [Armatimonadota bacterium]|nr:hypothetical protein [Armatimonadota bacterium]
MQSFPYGRAVVALAALPALLLAGSYLLAAETGRSDIDWTRAQQLFDRLQRGEALTPEERAYLDQAREARRQGSGANPLAVPEPRASTGLVPLDEMGADARYKGEEGGLYGGGRNEPPDAHRRAALAELAKVVPLDAAGKPSPEGKVVLISMGMSNTTQEFSRFKALADADPAKSPKLVIVDGAQGGKDAATWSDDAARPDTWRILEERLTRAGVTPLQVQVAWVKHARIAPARYGEYPAHAQELKQHIAASLAIARRRFPNLRVAYLSSRIYAGYARTPLNPEPYAYESAFAVRALILDQIRGDAALNYDASRGEVRAPLLLWGPYLWADGVKPRKSDGLTWVREDLAADGTHPSPTGGQPKVARLLLQFFKTNPLARGWFLGKE